MSKRKDIVSHLLRLAACALMLAAAAVAHNGKVLDCPVARASGGTEPAPAVRTAPDGTRTVDSSALAVAVDGYGGPVPIEVAVRDGRVVSVAPVLPNDETPMFFGLLDEAGFWHSWDDLPIGEALAAQVDAVASATYSSRAAAANVRAALGELASVPVASHRPPAETLAALAVLLAAAVLPLFPRTRSRRWRTLLLVLDVAVLGVWNDLFLSLDRLVGWATNGLPGTPADAAAALLLLAMAFLYPLFGRASHYCLHACPFGALQELASRLPLPKARLSPALVRALGTFRRLLWAAVMLSLWCGLEAPWTGWELFGAFAWRAVPVFVTALAATAVALSAFVPRAYCRFLCPTGTLLKTAEAPD